MSSSNNKMHVKHTHSDPSQLLRSSPKLAPRSILQFKIGPPFGTTIEVSPLFIKSSDLKMNPRILARIDRGFDFEDNKWVGYKRNYFSLVTTFLFEGLRPSVSVLQEHGFYLTTMGECHDIKRFALRLVSRNVEDNSEVTLIQHTAKRTIGVTPSIIHCVPGSLPSHSAIKQGFNVRNGAKVERMKQMFVTKYSQIDIKTQDSILYGYPKGEPFVTTANYERIQFTASVGRRRSSEKNGVIIQVQLLAELKEKGKFAIVAVANTPPLTIRGRSPSSYPKAKPQIPLQKVDNVNSFSNIPRYVPSPLSQGLYHFNQENQVPYSDGFLNSKNAFESGTYSKRSSSSSSSSNESKSGFNDITFFNTIDKLAQIDPLYRLTGEELSGHFSSSSFSRDYFTHSEGNSDITPLPDKSNNACVVPELIFRDLI